MFEYDEVRLGALEKRVAFRKQSARDKHVAADVGRLVVARKLADDVARRAVHDAAFGPETVSRGDAIASDGR